MINNVAINTTDILTLQNNVRISATSSYNFQEAAENIFEDTLQEEVTKEEKIQKNEINTKNLGKPIGFEMYEIARQENTNPLAIVQMKSAINNYLMQS